MEELEITDSDLKSINKVNTTLPIADKIIITNNQTYSPDIPYKDTQYFSKDEINSKMELLNHKIDECKHDFYSFNNSLNNTIDDRVDNKINKFKVWILVTCLTIITSIIGFVIWFIPYITNLITSK